MRLLLQDLCYTTRLLRKSRAATAVVVLSLLFGIVLNTSAFSVCNALWFRPLPFRDPERLVLICERNPRQGRQRPASELDFVSWRKTARTLEAVESLRERGFNVGSGRLSGPEPRRVSGAAVSLRFIEMLGYRPVKGRVFQPADFEPGAPRVALISDQLWRSWPANPDAIGSEITLDGEKTAVIGLLPRSFRFLYGGYNVIVPLIPAASQQGLEENNLLVAAKLKPGRTVAEAQAEMTAIAAGLERERPAANAGWDVRVSPLSDEWMREAKILYPVLLAAAGLILLIVCANVSNVLLARSAARKKEMAVRLALGAPRSAPVRLLLIEGVLLALMAGAAALVVCVWLRSLVVAIAPELAEIVIDWRVLSFTLLLSVAAGLLFGIGPALSVSRADINDTLHQEGGAVSRRSGLRLRRVLVISEMAVATIMLTGTGLLLKAVAAMLTADTGFRATSLLTTRVSLPPTAYPDLKSRSAFVRQALESVAALPGVDSVAASSAVPLQGDVVGLRIEVEGRAAPAEGQGLRAAFTSVSPAYFRTVRVPLVAGREFTDEDRPGRPPVAIINQKMAKDLWGGWTDIVGRRLRTGPGEEWRTIVGVAGDTRQDLLRPPFPEVFVPHLQLCPASVVLAMSTRVTAAGLADPFRRAFRGIDADLPVAGLRSLEDLKRDYVPPVYTVALAAFSGFAVGLVFIGLYGLVSYFVVESTREIGLRMALGALPRNVVGLVIGQGVGLAAMGALIGLAGSLGVGRLLSGMLPGIISPFDAVTFFLASSILFMVAAGASAIPARRASRLDPAVALRRS